MKNNLHKLICIPLDDGYFILLPIFCFIEVSPLHRTSNVTIWVIPLPKTCKMLIYLENEWLCDYANVLSRHDYFLYCNVFINCAQETFGICTLHSLVCCPTSVFVDYLCHWCPACSQSLLRALVQQSFFRMFATSYWKSWTIQNRYICNIWSVHLKQNFLSRMYRILQHWNHEFSIEKYSKICQLKLLYRNRYPSIIHQPKTIDWIKIKERWNNIYVALSFSHTHSLTVAWIFIYKNFVWK